jgi:uncharacterized protein YecE (DUF72 family)
MSIHIGTSGWSYDHWQGILYPRGASSMKRLEHYVRAFSTVGVNNTFYRWPRVETFLKWRERVPTDFVLSVKASRGLTQFRRLNDPAEWLKRMAEGLDALGDRLGAVLFQLPPQFAYNPERLDEFLHAAPRSWKKAFEFRHPSWHREETFTILERHHAAYCVMDGPGLPCVPRATTSFVYVRFHGPESHGRYQGGYPENQLRAWVERFRAWESEQREVFAYFNNDVGGHAVHDAETVLRLLARPALESSRG